MLVLSRKCNESIVIGGVVGGEVGFKVTVVGVKAGKVRLGVDADPDVSVHRWEVWERMCAGTGRPARRSSPPDAGRGAESRSARSGGGRGRGNGSLRKTGFVPDTGVEVRATSTTGRRLT